MLRYDMLYDGKPQSCAAGRFRTALVHAVETFKDSLLRFFWDTDPCVFHGQRRVSILRARHDRHFSTLFIVTHRIAAQIVDQFVDQVSVSPDLSGISLYFHRHLVLFRRDLHHCLTV